MIPKPLLGLPREEGAVAVIMALLLVVLFGFAALAVDGGLLANRRRDVQNAADNAALAAAWAACHHQDVSAAGLVSAHKNGFNNDGLTSQVTVNDLGDNTVEVVIKNAEAAQFSQAIGQEELTVGARSKAQCTERAGGAGALPFAALPGGSDGGLQVLNPCSSGNCRRIIIDRIDGITGAKPTLLANMEFGSDRILEPSWGPSDPRVSCSDTSSKTCNVVLTDTGVATGNLTPAVLGRLSNVANATQTFVKGSQLYNGDSLEDVLGGAAPPLGSVGQPPDWHPALHGAWGSTDLSNFYWYNGVIAKCDSPRLGGLPIISSDLEFDPDTWVAANGYPGWPDGSKPAKVLGHYLVYISIQKQDLTGNIKELPAKIVWLGPDATCANGQPIGNASMGAIIRVVSLLE